MKFQQFTSPPFLALRKTKTLWDDDHISTLPTTAWQGPLFSGAKRLSFQATHPPQLPEDLVAGIEPCSSDLASNTRQHWQHSHHYTSIMPVNEWLQISFTSGFSDPVPASATCERHQHPWFQVTPVTPVTPRESHLGNLPWSDGEGQWPASRKAMARRNVRPDG